MTMKLKALVAALAAAAVSTAYAGPVGTAKTIVTPPPPAPIGCTAFDGGLTVNPYAAYFIPDSGSDEFGGGLSVDYFFTPVVGISGFAQWGAFSQVVHNYGADLVLRYPMTGPCIAPYAFGGAGVHTNSETEFIGRLGAGIDLRRAECGRGIFADWAYTFAGGDLDDYQVVRLGVKLPF